MRVFSYLAGALALLLVTADVGAQFPGELRGTVVDVLSGRPVPAVDIRVQGTALAVVTDASGSFRLRGLEAGTYILQADAPGFASLEQPVVVRNGVRTSLRLDLAPELVELDGLTAEVEAVAPGARTLSGREIRALPARTAGDLAGHLPGVRIESRGRGASEVPSIRGSGGDAVLVLVDGVPVNDPVTGEADLSTIPASSVSAVHVLPGGRSARFGARAEGGVILVETGGAERAGPALEVGAGSLGERSADLSWETGGASGGWSLGAGGRRLQGDFDFDAPEATGGGRRTRENAHVRSEHIRVEWRPTQEGATSRLGVSGEHLQRGLPGRSFAPSRSAEQDVTRARIFGAWGWTSPERWRIRSTGYGVAQRVEHQDSMPPFGHPFHEVTTLRGAGAELQASYADPRELVVSGGLDVKGLAVRSTQLEPTSSQVRRVDAGAWVTASRTGPARTSLSAAVRVDHSGHPSRWYLSHDLGVTRRLGSDVLLRASHRSSFSPPTLGDQFFREGVGVAPNPDLEAERVPSEWTVGAEWSRSLGALSTTLEIEAYHGDIEGMILWLPDFRFIWSPRNRDVKRRGVEIVARVRERAPGWSLRAHGAWNRTTYDRPGYEDTQVVYRPELAGGALLSWARGPWQGSLHADFVGARYPVPNRVNRLPAFWTTHLSVRRSWQTHGVPVELGLQIDRLLNHEDALIFAYPDPGRTVRVSIRIGG